MIEQRAKEKDIEYKAEIIEQNSHDMTLEQALILGASDINEYSCQDFSFNDW